MGDVYHSDYSRLSPSMLSVLAKSPEEFHARFIAKTMKTEPTEAMVFGTLLHTLIMEPETVDDRFIVASKVDRRTKEGKAAWSEFLSKADGKEIVSEDVFQMCLKASDSIAKHDQVAKFLGRKADIETPLPWELLGVPMKCRPDAVYNDLRLIVDYKTTGDASPKEFARSVFNFGYDRQAWCYREAIFQLTGEVFRFLFVVVNKEEPYTSAVYELGPSEMLGGEASACALVREYKRRIETDDWKSAWTRGVYRLELPRYLKRDIELFELEESA
jgi:hypothetical protein